jgi:hypothetical protein
LGAAWRWRHVSLGFEARVDAPASSSAGDWGVVSAWSVLGAVIPCAYAGPAFLCAVGEAGALHAWGSKVSDARSPWDPLVQVGSRVGSELRLGEGAALRVHSDLLAGIYHTTLQLHGATVWTAPGVSGLVGVDAVLQFR